MEIVALDLSNMWFAESLKEKLRYMPDNRNMSDDGLAFVVAGSRDPNLWNRVIEVFFYLFP